MRQTGRALALCFLSAIIAEFLLGGQWLAGGAPLGQQAGEVLLDAAYYGSGALLIREVVRRTGRGWPSILVLGLAFGILEEGVVDESLFNPGFAAGQHLLTTGFIPALGISGPWTIYVLSLHVIWSIGASIAIAEGVFPRPRAGKTPRAPQDQAPWLGVPGTVVACVCFIAAGLVIFASTALKPHSLALPAQLVASALAVALVVIVALALPRRAPRGAPGGAVNPGIAVASAGVLTMAYVLLNRDLVANPWLASGLEALILTAGFGVVAAVRLDALGLALGAVVTYSWVGLSRAIAAGCGAAIEQAVLVALVFGVIGFAFRNRARVTAVTK